MIGFLIKKRHANKSSRFGHNQRIRRNALKDNTNYAPQRRPPACFRYRKRQYSHHHYYRTYRIPLLALSSLPLSPLTPAALLELLELPLRCLLASSGLVGCNPLARANRFNMSVRLTTPESRPDMCWPGSADAETEGVADKG